MLPIIGCEHVRMDFFDDKLKVINHSQSDIQVLVNLDYPDTSIEKARYKQEIKANGASTILILNQTWEGVLKDKNKVTIFIISEGKNDSESIEKIVLSKEQLDMMDWIVNYPKK